MTGNVIALSTGGPAVLPLAGQTEVAGALPANVVIAEMVVEGLWVGEDLFAVDPLAEMAWWRFLLGLLVCWFVVGNRVLSEVRIWRVGGSGGLSLGRGVREGERHVWIWTVEGVVEMLQGYEGTSVSEGRAKGRMVHDWRVLYCIVGQ